MAKPKHREKRRLAFEALEVRDLLAAFNVPWPEASTLTLSFASDGTAIANQTSELFHTLGHDAANSTWQEEILRAFQTWAVESNINIGLVSDNGAAFGTVGLKQGDLRFGDVRIGAFPMDSNILAVADPYDPFVANTWVGDVFFNSGADFDAGGQLDGYDVYSVAVHEAGHVFGIGHNANPASPMYPQFRRASEASLTNEDIASLRALYGSRPADHYDAQSDNGILSTATSLDLSTGSADVDADVTTLSDKDYYRFVAPAGAQTIDVKLEAAGHSLLVPHVSIVDANGNIVAEATADGPLNNDVHLALQNITAGQSYYIAVDSGRSDVFGIGTYHLEVETGAAGAAAYGIPASPDNSTSAIANPALLATTPGYVEHTYYEVETLLSAATPQRSYIVRSANLGPDMTNVMTVVLSAYDSNSHPTINVFDDLGQPMVANAIYDAGGKLEIQIPSVVSNKDYRVEIGGSDLSSTPSEYELEVDFDQDGAHLQTFVNDTLSAAQPEVKKTLTVTEGQQFHFALAASDWSNPLESGTQMTIEDAAGRAVFAMNVADGSTRSGDVFLNSGTYTVRFQSPQLAPGGLNTFQLSGLTVSEPLGPQLRDTTLDPAQPPAQEAISGLTFYWLPYSAPQPQVANAATRNESLPPAFDSGAQQATNSAPTARGLLLNDKTIATVNGRNSANRAVQRAIQVESGRSVASQVMNVGQGEFRAWARSKSFANRLQSQRNSKASQEQATSRTGKFESSAVDAFSSHWKRESAATVADGDSSNQSTNSGNPQSEPQTSESASTNRPAVENSPSEPRSTALSADSIDPRIAVACAALFACLAWPVQRPTRFFAAWEAIIDTAYLRWPQLKRLFRREV